MAPRTRDGQPIAIDGFELLETVLVELGRRQRQRGRGQDGGRVDRLAVRQRPDAIAATGAGRGRADRLRGAGDGRLDILADRGRERLALGVRQARAEAGQRAATPSVGVATIRSSCSMARLKTTGAAVRPEVRPSSMLPMWASTYVG